MFAVVSIVAADIGATIGLMTGILLQRRAALLGTQPADLPEPLPTILD